DKVGGVNISLSYGESKSSSKTTQDSNGAAASNLTAGKDITISATGAGQESDLTIQGSNVKAGNNVSLKADNEIKLLAAANTADLHSSNKNLSASVGISYGTDGLLLNVGFSGGRGKADGQDASWTNTHVDAGNKVTLESGSDTTLKGAVVSGPQVIAKVGGNLNLESLQDTSN
ncbi:MAG: hemagglutinin repeat-containing protein, partial [Betaproteobacteria bacterium]